MLVVTMMGTTTKSASSVQFRQGNTSRITFSRSRKSKVAKKAGIPTSHLNLYQVTLPFFALLNSQGLVEVRIQHEIVPIVDTSC